MVLQQRRHLPHAHTLAHASDDIQGTRGEFTQHADTMAQSLEFIEQPTDFGQHRGARLATGQQCLNDLSMLCHDLLACLVGCRYITSLGPPCTA